MSLYVRLLCIALLCPGCRTIARLTDRDHGTDESQCAPDGPCETRWPRGELKEQGNRRGGFRDGPWRKWHENGQLADESQWAGGGMLGEHKAWHPNGVLARHDQVGVRTATFYESGAKECEIEVGTGALVSWYESGQLKQRITPPAEKGGVPQIERWEEDGRVITDAEWARRDAAERERWDGLTKALMTPLEILLMGLK